MPSDSRLGPNSASLGATGEEKYPHGLRRYAIPVVLITLLAGVLRTLYLTRQGFTLDEGFSVYLSRKELIEFLHLVWRSEFNMALYYLLLRGWMVLGHSEWTIRFLGVLVSTATVPILFLLGSRLFDQRTGIVAALLLALHPHHLMLAQRARGYPLSILLVCVAALYFVRLVQERTWRSAFGYAVFSAAASFSHFFAVLAIPAQLVSVISIPAKRVPWKLILFSLGLLFVLWLPLIAFFLTHASTSHIDWVQDLSAQQVFGVLQFVTLSKARFLAYLVAWGAAAVACVRSPGVNGRWSYVFAFSWLVVPIAVTAIASLRHPLMIERYLSLCIPASILVCSAGIIYTMRLARTAGVILLAIIIFYSASAIRSYDRHPEFAEGWRESSLSILQRAQPGDAVIAESEAGLVFDYYHGERYRELPITRLDSFDARIPDPLPASIWVIGSVRFNPNWKGAVPGETEKSVQSFADREQGEYCLAGPDANVGETRVWHFRRCIQAYPNSPPQ